MEEKLTGLDRLMSPLYILIVGFVEYGIFVLITKNFLWSYYLYFWSGILFGAIFFLSKDVFETVRQKLAVHGICLFSSLAIVLYFLIR